MLREELACITTLQETRHEPWHKVVMRRWCNGGSDDSDGGSIVMCRQMVVVVVVVMV